MEYGKSYAVWHVVDGASGRETWSLVRRGGDPLMFSPGKQDILAVAWSEAELGVLLAARGLSLGRRFKTFRMTETQFWTVWAAEEDLAS